MRTVRGGKLDSRAVDSGPFFSGSDKVKTDYFNVLGIEPLLNLDMGDLERRFHDLSRKYHPDFHTTSSPEVRERALEMTALLNDAYRTLKDPSRRAEYLVRSQGFTVDGSKVPQALLAEVFEINEELEQLRAARKSGSAVDPLISALVEFRNHITQMRREYDDLLHEAASKWDRLVSESESEELRREQLSKLADIVSHSAYIRNLERDIETEVAQ